MAKKAPKRAKAVPLTKAQLQTDAGQELMELAEAITEDGLVSASEVTRLHRWLHRHADEGLPAVDFLNDEVDQLREDEKKGDSWPRRRLHRALERVLPKTLREQAKGRRKDAEALAFDWGASPAVDPPPAPPMVLPQPLMRVGVPTLLCPIPGVPNRWLREVTIPRRIAAGLMIPADQFRDLPDPPKKNPKPNGKTKASKAPPKPLVETDFKRDENAPTPEPFAWARPESDVAGRSRYRGELLWFDGKAWAVFRDPDDGDCRYAQAAG